MTPEDEKRARDCDRAWAASDYEGATLPVLDRRDLLAALDEARRERDEKTRMLEVIAERVGATTFNALLVEIARLAGAADGYRACCEAAGMVYDGGETYPPTEVAERIAQACDRECHSCLNLSEQVDEARQALAALLNGHLSPSDAVRQSAISATRRGWGM